jgi:hypothetical protein
MRIADVHRDGALQLLPGDRHGKRVHRIGQRDAVPVEARLPISTECRRWRASPRSCPPRSRSAPPRRGAADRAGCVAASLDLAAVRIEDAHAEIGAAGRFEQDQLVATDAVWRSAKAAASALSIAGTLWTRASQHDEVVADGRCILTKGERA